MKKRQKGGDKYEYTGSIIDGVFPALGDWLQTIPMPLGILPLLVIYAFGMMLAMGLFRVILGDVGILVGMMLYAALFATPSSPDN